MDALPLWLEATRLSQALRASPWAYPSLQTLHILGFTLLVGSIAMLDARLLGASRRLPITELARYLRRGSLIGAAVAVPSGALLFSAQPLDLWNNPVFGLKLAAIACAAVNAVAFHVGVYRSLHGLNRRQAAPPLARAHAALSLALWTLAIASGTLMAYT